MTDICSGEVITPLQSIIGEDGAQTFHNTKYNEAYHSKIGPIVEAEHKFVKPSCIFDLIQQNKKIKILDLFFGLGYNTGVALEYAYNISNRPPEIEITAIENDPEIIKKINELQIPEWYKKWQNILGTLCNGLFQQTPTHIQYENIDITLHLEDAFNLINKLPTKSFDVIFFDPFSHKVAPEFWMDDFLTSVFKLLATNGTLTTYSSLKRVEELAHSLGYKTKRVTPLGRKKGSLVITNS